MIEQVQRAWGLTVRDGFGQTETTAQVGNTPGQPLVPGSMGRPLPGYDVVLVDPVTARCARTGRAEGEICLRLDSAGRRRLGRSPLGLMVGYRDDDERTAEAMRGGVYHTGDVAARDADGYITYVGRADDVFKASDYRISPFELESVLIEHPAVAEAAVVPSPDPLRLAVPKAYVVLAAGLGADRSDRGGTSSGYSREHLAAVQADPPDRVRRAARRRSRARSAAWSCGDRREHERHAADGAGGRAALRVLGGRPAADERLRGPVRPAPGTRRGRGRRPRPHVLWRTRSSRGAAGQTTRPIFQLCRRSSVPHDGAGVRRGPHGAVTREDADVVDPAAAVEEDEVARAHPGLRLIFGRGPVLRGPCAVS